MQCLASYPASPVHVELDSPTLPDMVLAKMSKVALKTAAASPPGQQMAAVVRCLQTVLQDNKLLVAMDEVKAIKALAAGIADVKMNESKGTVLLYCASAAAVAVAVPRAHLAPPLFPPAPQFSIVLTDAYPDSGGLEIKLHKHTFPKALVTAYLAQAREVVRRCVAGYAPEVALAKALPVSLPAHLSYKKEDSLVLTSDFAKELRAVDAERKQGNAKEHANTAKVRREARRKLKRLAASEAAAEDARIAAHRAEVEAAAQAALTPHNETPTKSLYWVVKYLLLDFARALPVMRCKLSGQRLLPADPAKAAAYLEDKSHARHPVRLACGHWFRLRPLHAHMISPPFAHACPWCGERMYHPRWPAEAKKLEKAWGARLAKERELSEVSDMLDLGAEFGVQGQEAEAPADGLHDSDEEEDTSDLPPEEGGAAQ
ncbi:unnamed protein product [Symbiodinium sp. KB8]|nr:unnamed protein product [Symbiodinium sp. KB8]